MELEWEKIGRFGQRFYRSPIPGGWLVKRSGVLAHVPDPEHAWPGALAWEKMPSTQGRRAQVQRGWLLWWSIGLRYVRDESLAWNGLWESLHDGVFRSSVPGGWLVYCGGGMVLLDDPEHEWNGRSTSPSASHGGGDGRLSLPSE